MSMIDQSLPLDNTDPVQLNEEDFPLVNDIREDVDQLEQFRKEMGRLFQVLHNLRSKADSIEDGLRTKRMDLLTKYGISDGRWVINFDEKTLVRTALAAPNVV